MTIFLRWHKGVRWSACGGSLLLSVVLSGCDRDETRVYHVAKDTPPPVQPEMASDAAQPSTAPPPLVAQSIPPLKYSVPEGWKEKAPEEMRVASLVAPGPNGESADISVIPLPVVGRDLELVNMWRSRVQLPPTNDPEAVKQCEPVEIGSEQGRLYTFVSTQPIGGKSKQRLLEAMLSHGEMSWFFKIAGEDQAVTSQKKHFLEFLKSISFVGEPPLPAAEIATPAPAPDSGNSIWTVPPGWQPVPPAQFLMAQFLIPGANSMKAEVNVATLGGEGGGLRANVNRWRGQLGLDAMDDDGLARLTQTLDVPDARATLVDFSGKDAKTGAAARLVAAVVSQNGKTWFYKMMGDDQVVSGQKSAFKQFIQSANYANAR